MRERERVETEKARSRECKEYDGESDERGNAGERVGESAMFSFELMHRS